MSRKLPVHSIRDTLYLRVCLIAESDNSLERKQCWIFFFASLRASGYYQRSCKSLIGDVRIYLKVFG